MPCPARTPVAEWAPIRLGRAERQGQAGPEALAIHKYRHATTASNPAGSNPAIELNEA